LVREGVIGSLDFAKGERMRHELPKRSAVRGQTGTRGHSGLAKMVLGSVTASVLGRTTRPVAIAHEPKPEANA
jgi:hypothetical protein